MVVPQITLPDFFSIWNQAYGIVGDLGVFVLGMSVYAIFIFQFYRFLSRKDIFQLDLEKHNRARLGFVRKVVSSVFYLLKYLVMFPVFAFFWFVVIGILLSILAQDKSTENVFLVSMAVLCVIRISAYYNEALSTDLSKILPFGMLGIFLVDRSFLSNITEAIGGIQVAAARWDLMVYYLVVIVLLEFTLRILSGMLGIFSSRKSRTTVRGAPASDPVPSAAQE